MFRQTPFTNLDLNRSTVARRKGGRIRYFDPVTARMSGWMEDPFAEIRKADARNHRRTMLEGMTVPDLRALGLEALKVRFPSKMRKGQIVQYFLDA